MLFIAFLRLTAVNLCCNGREQADARHSFAVLRSFRAEYSFNAPFPKDRKITMVFVAQELDILHVLLRSQIQAANLNDLVY